MRHRLLRLSHIKGGNRLPVWLYVPLVILHVVVAVSLVLIVLLQAGKGAALGAAFGGASQTVFGPRGAGSFLGKLTTAAAGVFMITSLVLAIFSPHRIGGSVVLTTPAPKSTVPAATATTSPQRPEATGAGASQRSRGPEIIPSETEGGGATHR